MGKKKEPKLKKSALEIRNEIKHYIKNERDTILLKWKCLEQAVQTEDAVRNSNTYINVIINNTNHTYT